VRRVNGWTGHGCERHGQDNKGSTRGQLVGGTVKVQVARTRRLGCFADGHGCPVPLQLGVDAFRRQLGWTRLGGGALGVEGHYLLGYLFYVGDAE